MPTEFILNETSVTTNAPKGETVLDFIRYHQLLTGTKIGCREGDCGACTILVGELKNEKLHYSTVTSCLMPLGNAQGKHIVTIEGINGKDLNPVQRAMADEGATQCGFCTPGFVMSLTGFFLNESRPKNIIAAIDGNICRCTGYKSIERAAATVSRLAELKAGDAIEFAASQNIVPAYFKNIKDKLLMLNQKTSTVAASENNQRIGGGTDLYVQKHDEMKELSLDLLFDNPALKGITKEENDCIIGPSATVTDLHTSPVMREHFPELDRYVKLVSSTPIRNMATVGGNFVNASPIGDLTIFFLALDAELTLSDGSSKRNLLLRKFYKGYKTLDKLPNEFIESIRFKLPDTNTKFHFEKVSKRTNLDIASVNSAALIKMNGNTIREARFSAGGVGPVPMFLQRSSEFLAGKTISENLVAELIKIVQSEISPISDARGSAEYKRLLLSQLIKAHFLTLFPGVITENILLPS